MYSRRSPAWKQLEDVETFSCWPLHCGSFNAKADDRFVFQLTAHIVRLDTTNMTKEAKALIKVLDKWKNKFCEYQIDVAKI